MFLVMMGRRGSGIQLSWDGYARKAWITNMAYADSSMLKPILRNPTYVSLGKILPAQRTALNFLTGDIRMAGYGAI